MKTFAAIVLSAASAAALAQDFYEERLRAGVSALGAGRAADAADALRIAAFGLLDRPALLCEALGNLAVAQQATGARADADASISRYAQTARQFPACRDARFSAERRRELETIAARSLSPALARELFEPPARPATPAPTAVAAAPAPVPATPTRAPVPTRPAPTPPPTAAPAAPTAAPPPTRAIPAPATPTRPPPAPLAPTAASPSGGPAVADAGELDRQPQLKSTTRPVYPPSAARARVGGVVLVRVLVSETGEPVRVEIARGIGPDLDAAALDAVRQWRFEPARKAGAAVAAWMNVAVPFEPARR